MGSLTLRTRLRIAWLWLVARRRYRVVQERACSIQAKLLRPLEPREVVCCLTCLRQVHGIHIVPHTMVFGTCQHCLARGNMMRIMLAPQLGDEDMVKYCDSSWEGIVKGVLDE